MLKSCKYCMRIHDSKIMCAQKKEVEEERWKNRENTRAFSFRKSHAWTQKSLSVRTRDKYQCLCCKALLEGTVRQYNSDSLSVHHITPIEEDYGLRLDEFNLITVCDVHHELCEAGKISRETQRQLVLESMELDGEDDVVVCC